MYYYYIRRVLTCARSTPGYPPTPVDGNTYNNNVRDVFMTLLSAISRIPLKRQTWPSEA